MLSKVSISTFLRYNISSVIATFVDFIILIVCTEFFKLWYMLSATLGAVSGGIVSFILGRNWAFKKSEGDIHKQAIRYFITWIGSILLNVGGLYFFVDILCIQYILSKVAISILVGLLFNYVMQKKFIFR